jgi:uncharacterized protein
MVSEGIVAEKTGRTPEPRIVDEIVRRIVEVADPEQIIMFGSAARGEMGPNSDIDLLVVKADAHRLETLQAIRRGLRGVGQAIDLIVATPDDVARYRDTWCLVIEPALREGKLIYAKRAFSGA